MDFKTATDRLMELGLTADALAKGLGLAPQTVRAMRLDPSSESYRRPPEDWRSKLAALARARGEALAETAEKFVQEVS